MQVTVSNNIVITNPSEDIKKWCETHLKLDNPDYAKKVRMGFWVGKTPKHLYLYEVQGDKYILPFGTLNEILPMVSGTSISREKKAKFQVPLRS